MKTKKLLLGMIIAGCSIASLQAKSIYYVKVNGTGTGASWSNAAGNVQDMIDKAVAGDEVWVAAGTYIPTTQTDANDNLSRTFLIKNGVNLYGGFAGNEASIDDRAKSDMDGNGKVEAWEFTNETILSGKLDGTIDVWKQTSFFGQAWVWSISGSNANCKTVVTCGAEVTDETIFDGFTVSDGNGNAGIWTQGNTVIQNCIVAFNSAGITNVIGTVTNSHIYINAGRGVYNRTGTISYCTIEKNASYTGSIAIKIDGGIYNLGGDIVNCIVMNNQIIAYQLYSSNTVPYVYGGGIYNDSGKIDKCIVANNTILCYNAATNGNGNGYVSANALGGGIYNTNSAGIVSNCCVFNNRGTAIKSSNMIGAVANESGGGISGGTVYNSTVVNNKCDGSELNSTSINCISTTSTLNQNFVRPSTFVGTTTSQEVLNTILNSDWRLIEGSQYIDAGSLDNLPDWLISGTDLAGNSRTHDGKISKGAYEYDASYTSIKELPSQSGISISPSPATDFVTVSGLQGNETLYFYNINGQLLITSKAAGETENIPVSNLPSGIYLLKVDNGQTVKWIKK